MQVFQNRMVSTLEQAMNAAMLRQRVIANNLANVETPGFKAADVAFENLLAEALARRGSSFVGVRTDPRHLPIGAQGSVVAPRIVPALHTRMRHDGNNVDVDAEMANLSRNALWYQALVQSTQHYLDQLRTVIGEGRR
ncbi:MAG TPA: flagellar basal body rod protein FlgB [Calditerricola sp.]